jgi:hypothetical protein
MWHPFRCMPLGIALALSISSAAVAQLQVNQQFVPQGPSPSQGPTMTVQSADAPPLEHVAGAMLCLAAVPLKGPSVRVDPEIGTFPACTVPLGASCLAPT